MQRTGNELRRNIVLANFPMELSNVINAIRQNVLSTDTQTSVAMNKNWTVIKQTHNKTNHTSSATKLELILAAS